ncbi:hypothetical protein BJ138DRAFT_1119390 [Hygrophoropsis aurantiaca]|uniref:Uncharacterized protein n=1 Tax=Hygrophoropsis aurantiaca TaxID=72124 RepID=A0ACB7ZVU5_9AGAM|nr:hypothetical protein BJ138DRAFT_1119390 [Hygrophoropsis aurantiaca]
MADPLSFSRYCFTPLASYVVDLPEACMLSCVGGKTSPVTTAMYKQFGDNNSITESPNHIEEYFKEVQRFRLNGVAKPFWRDWPLADPYYFLNTEPLHYWHKFSWDHEVQWAINIVGADEIDYRFNSILQPMVGYRHFKEGISTLKQVTGRTQRDVQRYLIGIIAGRAPRDVVIAIRALIEFRYIAQAPEIDDDDCNKILAALQVFHDHKAAIIKAGGRRGAKNLIDHWYIPKLELLQHVVRSIRQSGVPAQWSADATEHAHIIVIKNPARSTNNNDYDPQICCFLDRTDRCFRCHAPKVFGSENMNFFRGERNISTSRHIIRSIKIP